MHVAMFWPADEASATLSLEALTEAIRREPTGTVPAIVRASAEGSVVVDSPYGDPWYRFALAAVAAAARVSWAWDDSPAIDVTINGHQITIDPRYTGHVWETVEVAPPRSNER